jgi:ABC-2 type transport system permease protein
VAIANRREEGTVRSARIYLLYLAQFFKGRLAYKWDFFASLFGSLLASFSGLLFLFFLMDGSTVADLRGWTRDEVLFIYGYSFIATGFFLFLAPNLFQFGDRYVIQGQFDRVLLRPLGTLGQVLFESFSLESLGNVFVGIGVLIYASARLNLNFSAFDYLWLVISTVSGAAILLSVFIFLTSLSFHFEDRIGITPPFYNLISFSRYPLPIFHRVIQFVLSGVVPFAFVAFFPATHFFAKEGFAVFCYMTPLVAVVTALIALWAWQFGVSRYASVGN